MGGGGRSREISSASSLPKYLQWLELGWAWAKTGSQELNPDLPPGWQEPS